MNKLTEKLTFDSQLVRLIFLSGFLILAFAGFMWYENIYKNPSNVFFGMIDNNLSTYGVTRSIAQKETAGFGFERDTKISYIPEFSVASKTRLVQNVKKNKTVVVTKSITKNNKTVSSYVEISGGDKDKNYNPIINRWFEDRLSKDQVAETVGLVPGFVAGTPPFLNLDNNTKQSAIEKIKANEVYDVDFGSVKKTEYNGKSAYEYDVDVNIGQYLYMMRDLSNKSNIDISQINIDAYTSNPPIELLMTVSIDGRQLLKAIDKQTGREETFSSYGAVSFVNLPTVNISKVQIEKLFK